MPKNLSSRSKTRAGKWARRAATPVYLFVLIPWLWAQGAGYAGDTPDYRRAREAMVSRQIADRGVADKRVLAAMRAVPRHLFVPAAARSAAYGDHPLRIDDGQTISQPYIVAFMTEQLRLTGSERVLEIGTGSGYQAAVLSLVAAEIYSIEIKAGLHRLATAVLEELNFANVNTLFGDGYFGWKEQAPFDCIMITAAVDHVPPPLLAQLVDGGKMILPLGSPYNYFGQSLVLITKKGEDYEMREILPVRFVPMTGRALEKTR